jgi:hypothetical protein
MNKLLISVLFLLMVFGIVSAIEIITVTIDDQRLFSELVLHFSDEEVELFKSELINLKPPIKERLFYLLVEDNNEGIINQLKDYLSFNQKNQSLIINDDLLKNIQSKDLSLSEIIDIVYYNND